MLRQTHVDSGGGKGVDGLLQFQSQILTSLDSPRPLDEIALPFYAE
jgi:hypothetical protein